MGDVWLYVISPKTIIKRECAVLKTCHPIHVIWMVGSNEAFQVVTGIYANLAGLLLDRRGKLLPIPGSSLGFSDAAWTQSPEVGRAFAGHLYSQIPTLLTKSRYFFVLIS